MTHAQNYPGANRTAQWGGTGRPNMARVDKLLLHTTETASWPGYGKFFPTLTFNPWAPRGQRWRQHYPIGDAATTLQNSGAFQTNRANVVQVEIVAYCDPGTAAKYGHDVRKIPADALADLGEFWAWLGEEWEVPLVLYPRWKAYPASYGRSNGVRMSASEFAAFKGVCGHQHAPGNDHGDPGLLDVQALLAAAQHAVGGSTPAPVTPAKPGEYPTPTTKVVYVSKLHPGQKDSDSVWWVQRALGVTRTGTYDAATVAAVKAFQASLGDDVDGDLGPLQTSALFKAHADLGVRIEEATP